ncbi:MAG TPA: hypothetical protein ACFYD1_06730 [Candidatus Hypogeohydataceae bacterium YC38]|nr:hypothetical protein [Candidatus Brocadiales bacterium]
MSLFIGLFFAAILTLTARHADRAEGNPHEIWDLADNKFTTLEQVVKFLNDRHIHKVQIVNDAGFFRVIYEL